MPRGDGVGRKSQEAYAQQFVVYAQAFECANIFQKQRIFNLFSYKYKENYILLRSSKFKVQIAVIGIIRRKAMIKDLAAIYHAECLAYCQELLELQKKVEESLIDAKTAEDSRRETMRPPKRMKKAR
ncbi:uncharacterized protein LOC107811738 isoform X1 [Nicotiana tabacum]|uniref:Uncharacterized protein LOC107811738 isoform X1 n=1 Tax=Nicotiana tabacum TaxID=4097 RepID=A0AC58SP88_TOBAC